MYPSNILGGQSSSHVARKLRKSHSDVAESNLAPKVAAVNARVSVPLYQGQHDASVSLVYNIGEGAFAKSTALKKINAGRHEEVPAQIKRWNRAGGKVLKGLERRREAEAALYEMRWY